MGSGERDGKRASFNGVAKRNCGGIDTNFTNSHGLTQTDSIEVVRFVPIGVIRVSNLTRLLPLPVRRGEFLVVRARGAVADRLPFRSCKFL
jgi:hypothetical protein